MTYTFPFNSLLPSVLDPVMHHINQAGLRDYLYEQYSPYRSMKNKVCKIYHNHKSISMCGLHWFHRPVLISFLLFSSAEKLF